MRWLAFLLLGTCVANATTEGHGFSFTDFFNGLVDKYYAYAKKMDTSFDGHDSSSHSPTLDPKVDRLAILAPPLEASSHDKQHPHPDQESLNPEKGEAVISHPAHILPHKATYAISLDKNYGQDDVADANGWMTIQVIDTGDGWIFDQHSSLIIYNSEGEAQQINTRVNSWQNYPGDRYRFNCSTLRNGVQEDNIEGEAKIENNQCMVQYSKPTTTDVQLPSNTIFPLHYLIHVLNEAKAGKTVVSDVIFDGSSETQEPVAVDTIVGAPQDPHLIIGGTESLMTKKVWPMHIAVYPTNSNNPDPDYEMRQSVLDVGIVKDMTLDYGTFSVKATIEKIELFTS
jgi:hypothetical protein